MYDHVSEQRCNSFKNDLIFTGIVETNPQQTENCVESINNFIKENIENDRDINIVVKSTIYLSAVRNRI